jgi:hypothetical protein
MSVLTSQAIIEKLFTLGHFHNPSAMTSVTLRDLPQLNLSDEATKVAIKSFQDFHIEQLERLAADRQGHVYPVVDGAVGPLTQALFKMERCGCPDYQVAGQVAEATGNGSWVHSCNIQRPGIHVITVSVDKSRMPGFLAPVFESQVWELVTASYADIGVIFERRDGDSRANIDFKWEKLRGSTIGLAIVPGAPMECSQRIWAKFTPTYQPGDVVNQWSRLVAHELGHNMRLQHTRGGIMNPSITSGPFVKTAWRNDPSYGVLKRYFGGEPVDLDGDAPEPEPPPKNDPPPNESEYLVGPIQHIRNGEVVGTYDLIPARRV